MTTQDYSEALAHEVAHRRDTRIHQQLTAGGCEWEWAARTPMTAMHRRSLTARAVNDHLAVAPTHGPLGWYIDRELPLDADIPPDTYEESLQV